MPTFDPGSRSRLGWRDLGRFPGESLFDRIGRAVCAADVLPRKELYESWEVARRARVFPRGVRVVDLAAGHGLIAYLMLLLDPSAPSALAVDARRPASAEPLAQALIQAWPRLAGKVEFIERPIETVPLQQTDLVVSAHACGALTDRVLDRAIAVRAHVAVLPCCQSIKYLDHGGLDGWLEPTLAIDVVRAQRLAHAGYRVKTQQIRAEITEKNRLLLGIPKEAAPEASDQE
ncbi:MAG: methyltransferase [Myxococcota bacterium]